MVPSWFRRLGTPDAPGTTLVTVSGSVRFPGVVEVELGTPVADILDRAGVVGALSAVLVGGYGGAWLDAGRLATPYAPAPLAAAGASSGVGIVIALPTTSCGVAETARVVRYMAGQSAGQCGPCVFGLPTIADDLEQLWAGRADPDALARIERRAGQIDGRGACRHPDGVVRLVRSAMTVFAADAHEPRRRAPVSRLQGRLGHDLPADRHRRQRAVMTARRRIGLRLRVDPVACDAYGYCAELLPERVTLDEWGYPMVDGAPVEHDLVELAVRAAAECPRRAVLLEEVTVVG